MWILSPISLKSSPARKASETIFAGPTPDLVINKSAILLNTIESDEFHDGTSINKKVSEITLLEPELSLAITKSAIHSVVAA